MGFLGSAIKSVGSVVKVAAPIVGNVLSSPLGKAALVATGLGGVAVAANALSGGGLASSVLKTAQGLGITPNAVGQALRGTGPAVGPTTGAPISQSPGLSRAGVTRPVYTQQGTYVRGKFVSPYDPIRSQL